MFKSFIRKAFNYNNQPGRLFFIYIKTTFMKSDVNKM
jgi:hypothetical protein